MSAQRWTDKEELELIKYYSEKMTFENISKKLNRSSTAVKLRLEMVVYNNISKGRSIKQLAKVLKSTPGEIMQMFYTHRDFRQKNGKPVIDIDQTMTENVFTNGSEAGPNNTEHNVDDRIEISKEDAIQYHNKIHNDNHLQNQYKNSQLGGHNQNEEIKQVQRLRMIERENKILKAMFDNYKMKRELKRLYRERKLDKQTRKMFKNTFLKN